MKRLNKFIAILFAAFGVQTLSAQDWTASNVGAGTYYIYNVGADQFLCSGNNWGSHASVAKGGIPLTLAGSVNTYTISTASIYSGKYLSGDGWLDGGSHGWEFESVGNGVYKLKNGSNVLYWNGGTSTNTTVGGDPGTTASQWMLVTEENRVAALANATQAKPIDATFLIKNAYLAKGNGHYFVRSGNHNSLSTSTSWKGTDLTDFWGLDSGNEDACYAIEQYGKQFDNYQELTVPNGKYYMTAKGFYRGDVIPYIYANSEKCNLKQKGDIGGDNLTNGAIALRGDTYLLDGVTVIVTDGKLRVGVKSDSWMDWCMFDDFRLTYYGKDLTLYENALKSAITEANAINKSELNTAITNKLNEEVTKSQNALNDANKTVESLEKQTASLKTVVELAKNSIAPYASLKSLISLCTEYTDNKNTNANSVDILNALKNAITTATSTGNTAVTVDAINSAYNELEDARKTYTQNAVPVYPYAFDMTFLLDNVTFDSNIDGWTTKDAGWMIAGNVECYNNTFTFSKSLIGLGNGSWEVSVDGFYRYGGYNEAEAAHNDGTEELLVKFFANASEVGLMSIMEGANKAGNVGATTSGGMRVPNSPAEGNIYFETGCYNNTVVTLVTDGKLTLGLKKESTKGSDWTLFDNFKLVYKGIDVSELQTKLTALISKANGIKSSKMGATEKTNLTNALNAADATITIADRLNEMLSELQSAYDAAVASIDTYSTVPAYITKANKIDASIAANYQTQYNNGTLVGDAETIRHELSVATFNYVKENFKNEIQLTTWGAESNAMWSAYGEHWDGTTGEGSTSYYDANGTNTTHTLSKTVELTPGTYVFRGAGRSNTNTTLSLSISLSGVEPVVFNAKGNTGRGIDKEGNATFADEAQYARDGQGQGWEWEFIKFTLNEKTSVTLTATCKTTGWGWASFANNGLWMDDATYVVANKGALSGPKANAEALVDTKPMGAAENAALKEAISRAEGTLNTPADLNGAIDALNKAVEAANAWVPKYNEEKVPLVEALERFETDFNLEGTPNHKYISKNAWNNVLDMVKEAALAKDVTDSYEGFADAANNLNAALDAAQKSINTYANFAAEISYAKAYTPIVSGNIAGHTASINAAETAYNAAEIEDPSELILAMQNYRVQDYNYVKENYTAFELTGDWTGQTNLHSGEHWSGKPEIKYFDYSKHSSNNIDGANEATLTTTLPAGEYILMAAGRAAAIDGTEAYIKVDETKVNFAAKSNRGYGIDVNGDANFATPTDSTYAMNNEGYGWEYRFIAFTLEKETEVKLVAGMTIDHSTAELSWASVCTPVLYITPIAEAKARLQKAIDDAENAIKAYAVGEEAFQVSESSEKYVALEDAIATAKNVINTANTVNVLNEAIAPLESVTGNYRNGYVLNAPEAGQRFRMIMDYEGWEHHGKAVTYLANNRNDMGMYNIKYYAAPNNNYAQAFTFTPVPVDGQTNCYTLSMTDVDGNERYVCTGTVYDGGNASQLRTTTDPTQALAVKVIVTTTDGIYNLWNTEANNYIGGQDAGFFTVNSHINFNIREAAKAEVAMNISAAKWSTLILPFNAALPEGVKAYSCNEADVETETLTLTEATTLKANTPYLINGEAGTHEFSGYGLAKQDTYAAGIFTGTYVDYHTTANSGTYVLQKHDNVLAFYLVGESAQPWVRAYRCYITLDNASTARMFSFGFDNETTGIDNAQLSTGDSELIIFDIMGRKVTSMKKGNLYIINGKKVFVK